MLYFKPSLDLGGLTLWRWLSPDEREARERARLERKRRKEVLKEQKREVRYLAKAIPVWLAKMGHAYWYPKSEKDLMRGAFNPVKIDEILIGSDSYYFRVDTRRLPRGVDILGLKDEKTVETLTAAAGSEVSTLRNQHGFWYVVEARYGRGNIPTMVGYGEMLKRLPDDAPPLGFPLGLGENQRPYFGDMAKMINLLVGGTKGGGKSNIINVMLCTLLTRNAPQNLRVILTDLKGGIEFSDYWGIPHLGGDTPYTKVERESEKGKTYTEYVTHPRDYRPEEGEELLPPLGGKIYTEPGEVLPMLRYVESELDRRARMLAAKRGIRSIASWNNKYPSDALSYWIVVIDELATLMENRKYSRKAADSLSEIARKGRAVGIFLVLATQTPSSSIVPQQIANNMDSRLAFRTGSGTASGVLLGTGEYDAVRLPSVPGRFIFKQGGEKTEMQAPFIQEEAIPRILDSIRAGQYVDAQQAELANKAAHMFQVALYQMGGECATNRLYRMVKGDGLTQRDVRTILAQYEAKVEGETIRPEIAIDDNVYFLAPADNARKIPRCLVPVAEFKAGSHPYDEYDFGACRVSRVATARGTVLDDSAESDQPDDDSVEAADDEIEWESQWWALDEKEEIGV